MRPYILDEAWIKLDEAGSQFVFCTEDEACGGVCLEFDIGTDGESWAINSISATFGWFGSDRPSNPLTGRLLTQAVSFYSEHLYQEFAEHVRDHYEPEDERLIERWKEAS